MRFASLPHQFGALKVIGVKYSAEHQGQGGLID